MSNSKRRTPAHLDPGRGDPPRRGWLGVLGGMGPLATTDFISKVIRHTAATYDQDHVPMLVVSDPSVPDRTHAICSGGPDPWPHLLRGARLLEAAQVGLAVIPCNTAHHWFDRLVEAVPLQWLHIADAAGQELEQYPGYERQVGLLATSGTVAAKVYALRLAQLGIEWHLPTSDEQRDLVDGGVRAVKSGSMRRATEMLAEAEQRLYARGAGCIILACTEIPLVLSETIPPSGLHRIDATESLARLCVNKLTHDALALGGSASR